MCVCVCVWVPELARVCCVGAGMENVEGDVWGGWASGSEDVL